METAVDVNAIFRDKKRRVWELDFLRGLAVICMCFDHLMYDFATLDVWFENFYELDNSFINAMFEFAQRYWVSGYSSELGFRFWAHYIFVFLFLFLVGTSCAFSRDNIKRGAALGVVAMLFSGVTFALREIGIMGQGVVFGILDCIALSILCAAAVDIATKKCKPLNTYLPLVLGVAVIAVGIGKSFWNIRWDHRFDGEHLIDYIMGARAYGDDWFGLVPYVGAVLMGLYFGKAAYRTRTSLLQRADGAWNKPIKFVGRHALIFYLAHQVVLAVFVILLCLCLGYKLAF